MHVHDTHMHIQGTHPVVVLTVSSDIKTFHPARELLQQGGKQQKQLQEVLENDQIH